MRVFFTLFYSLCFLSLFAQVPNIEWQRCLGGSGIDVGWSIQPTTDGGSIVVGATESNDGDVSNWYEGYDEDGNRTDDYWVIKLNSSGSIEWEKTYGGSNNDAAHFAQQTIDGGYVVVGSSWSNDGDVGGHYGTTSSSDIWVLKLDNLGNLQWENNYGGNLTEWGYSIQQTVEGGYIIAGYTGSNSGDVTGNHGTGTGDFWVFKTDASGNLEWQKCLGGSDYERAFSIKQTTDGGYVVTGQGFSWDGQLEGCLGGWSYWIVKLDVSGEIEWKNCYGGSASDNAYKILQTSDGGYIVAGNTESNDMDVSGNHGISDYWILKLDNTGNIEWSKCYGGSDQDGGGVIMTIDIAEIDSGGYFMACYTYSSDGDITEETIGNSDIWALKIDDSGNIEWQRLIGGTAPDRAVSVSVASDGGYMIAGFTYSNDVDVSGYHGNGDYWIVKLDSDMSIDDMQETDVLFYPNPVKSELTINSERNVKEVSIYNLIGQEMKNEKFNLSNFKIDVSNISQGTYTCRLIFSDGESETFKIIKH